MKTKKERSWNVGNELRMENKYWSIQTLNIEKTEKEKPLPTPVIVEVLKSFRITPLSLPSLLPTSRQTYPAYEYKSFMYANNLHWTHHRRPILPFPFEIDGRGPVRPRRD